MANLYSPDGTVTVVNPAGKKWTLAELQGHVEGDIEMMPGIKARVIFNDIGALKLLPVNMKASLLVQELLLATKKPLRYLPVLRGNVLVLDPKEKM